MKSHQPLSDDDRKAYQAEIRAFSVDVDSVVNFGVWETVFDVAPVVDTAIMDYWAQRCDECRHPVMRARYADLLWSLRQNVTGERGRITDARTAINAYVQTASLPTEEDIHESIIRLQRALGLALSIGDKTRIEAVCDAMLGFSDRLQMVDSVPAPTFLFDVLVENKKVPLKPEQREKVVETMERRLAEATDQSSRERFDPHEAEEIMKRLVRHYQKAGRNDDVMRVVRAYGQAFEHLAAEAGSLLAMQWLKGVHEVYRRHGMMEDADRVSRLSKQKGAGAEGEMRHFQVAMTLEPEVIEAIVQQITAEDWEAAIVRIVVEFIPRKDEAEEVLKKLSQTSLLAHLGTTFISDQQIIAEVGPVRDDAEGNLIVQIHTLIEAGSDVLALVLDRVWSKFNATTDDVLRFLYKSPLFIPEREGFYRRGLDAYFIGDHLTAIHVLIPQIEHALRNLLGFCGQATSKAMRSKKGVMQEKSLTDILESEEAVKEFFKRIQCEDWHLYLRTFLTDPRGHNLRNRLSHGLLEPGECGRFVGDRVIHILLMLATICDRDENGDSSVRSPDEGEASR